MLLLRAVFLASIGLSAGEALACGQGDLQAEIEAAQSLAPQTPANGKKLLACPHEAGETSQWLAFYKAMTEKGATSANLPKWMPIASDVPGEIGRDIAASYSGGAKALQAKLDSGDPRYGIPEVYLALARAAVRGRDFAAGRRYYVTFLRLRGDSYREEAEYLFTYIWEGDMAEAERQFARVDLGGTPLTFRAAVERGKQLIQKAQGLKPNASTADALQGNEFFTNVEAFTIKDEMQRLSGSLGYQGLIDAHWRHHIVHEQVYDQDTFNADEFWIGKQHTFDEWLTLRGYVGYLTGDNLHYLADTLIRAKVISDLTVGVGYTRQPLFTTVPLAAASIGVLEGTTYGEVGWSDVLVWRFSYIQDDDLAPFERHEVKYRQQVDSFDQNRHTVSILGLAAYEGRSRPSPDYESYRTTTKVGLGAATTHKVAGDYEAATDATYILLLQTPNGNSTVEQHSSVEVNAKISTDLSKSWRVGGKVSYTALQTDRPAEPLEQRIAVMGTIELLQ